MKMSVCKIQQYFAYFIDSYRLVLLLLYSSMISWAWLGFFFFWSIETTRAVESSMAFHIEKDLKTDCLLKVDIKYKMCVRVSDCRKNWYRRFWSMIHISLLRNINFMCLWFPIWASCTFITKSVLCFVGALLFNGLLLKDT